MRMGKSAAKGGARTGARRNMGSGAPPPTEGIDGVVRKDLPGDHHVAMGIIGGYFGLYLVSKIVGALTGSKKVETKAAPAAAASGGDIPSIEDPNFGAWLEGPGNVDKLVSSLETL